MTAVMRRLRGFTVLDPLSRWWFRLPWPAHAAIFGGLLLFAVLFPQTLSPYWQSVLFFPVGVYVLLALGLNIVVGQTGLLDLGYVAFYAVGAYTTAVLGTTADWPIWATLPAAIVMAMIAGVVLGGPTLRLRGDYLAIVTLGFGEIVRIVAQNSNSLGEARGITRIPHPTGFLGIEFGQSPLPYYYLTLTAVIIAVIVVVRLRRSRVGRAWAAIREDEDAAELMGVPTFTMKLWSFAMGATTGGLAGWIYASKVSFINPDNFPLFLSIVILAAVVLGGMGSIPGVIAGGFAIAFLPEYLRDVAAGETLNRWLNTITGGHASNITEYRVLLFGFALVVVMIFRPQGILPSRQRAAELAEAGATDALGAQPVPADVDQLEVDPTGDPTPAPEDERDDDGTAPAALPTGGSTVADGQPILVATSVTMQFGGVVALRELDLEVRSGEIFGIIGPNGAGKTTVFNCLTGVFRPTRGAITLEGIALVGERPHRITRAGLARTFQNIRLFPNMTALVNVVVGTDARHTTSVPGALLGLGKHRREEREGRAEARRLLDFVGIGARGDDLARNLPYGDQRRLEIARAMATGPKVLLLDEPAAGMNPSEKVRLVELIRSIRAAGYTVVLIEHDMGLVMNVCERIAVLDFGEKIFEGTPAEVQQSPRVIEAYLGAPADAS